ncbi:sigma-54-dependent Fis family transcriptional regulator [Alteribacter lacisalsi]|uniref:Sigma-54-dependent Fis family transcriptional regulator n=1 Tax=Alteribacter lacisalsi TaxID=2045244 RepID=A0A2W0HNA1_9BACI|nr:sigma-54-dependent Fis family transcriptional regulator [Alteribacter lacisalsi]PYZ98562.1 sigma-54-dependent Fis family transcriptional regulator [Alteribacter lacisalsi]
MKRILIIGGGQGGSALLELLHKTAFTRVTGVVDLNADCLGAKKAEVHNIPFFTRWQEALNELKPVDAVIEVTGNAGLLKELREEFAGQNVTLIPSSVASILFYLIEEKEKLIEEKTEHFSKLELILNSTHDGMIAIDNNERITLINSRAEEMSGLKKEEVLGKPVGYALPSSELPRVLHTGKTEQNRRQTIRENRTIVATRFPMKQGKRIIGALSVFRDITDIEQMAEEVTSLKSVQTMLEAIIHSSDDAISVVDEEGKGLIINPAYTRLTGLTSEEVLSKPATTDISEGKSMHLQVLKTRKPVRGVRMKVGPKRKDVLVNVAPVIVDGKLKGSVGVIHDVSELETLNSELERARQIIRTLEAKYTFEDIIGKSGEFTIAIEQAQMAAKTPATILLRGESGTGKELFAHAIHNASDRKYNKFVRVNCAAISESLLESELFGYDEGAFSGARRGGKKGLFEEAHGGTIFLDEIGELSSQTQAKLLRVLQEKEVVRVGSTKTLDIDVRVVAATNVNMEEKMYKNEFRSDLYYRLNRMPIQIPPLRMRKEDLPALCDHLLTKLNQDYGRNVEGLTQEALSMLREYDWPGNVRELENILGRAMIHMHYSVSRICVDHLPSLETETGKTQQEPSGGNGEEISGRSLQEQLADREKQIIVRTLNAHGGNKTKTAEALGLSLRNLYYKIEKLDISSWN